MDNFRLIADNTTGDDVCHWRAVINLEPVRKFLRDIVDPEMFGHAVTSEVRREAMRLLELLK